MDTSHDPWSSVPIRSQFLDASLHSDLGHDPIIGLSASLTCLKSSLERITSEAFSDLISLKASEKAILKQYVGCLNRSSAIAEKLESSDGSCESVADLVSVAMQALSQLTPTENKLIIASSFVNERGDRAPVSILIVRRPTTFTVLVCNPNAEARSYHSSAGDDHVQSCLFIDKVQLDVFVDNPCILYAFFRMATESGEQFPQSVLYEVLVPIISGRSLAELKCSQPSSLPYRRPCRSRFSFRAIKEVILNGLALSGFHINHLKTISHLIRLCSLEDASCAMDPGFLSRQTVLPIVQSMANQVSKHKRSGFVSGAILKRSAKVVQELVERIEPLPSTQATLGKLPPTAQWLPLFNMNDLVSQFQKEDAFIAETSKTPPLPEHIPQQCLSLFLKAKGILTAKGFLSQSIQLSQLLRKYFDENRLRDPCRVATEVCQHVESFSVEVELTAESSSIQIKSVDEQRQIVDAIMNIAEIYLSTSYSLPEQSDDLYLIRWRRTIVLSTLTVLYDLVIRSASGHGTAISLTMQRFHLDLCDRNAVDLNKALQDAQFPNEPKMATARLRLIQYFRNVQHGGSSQPIDVYKLSGQIQSSNAIMQFIRTSIINGQIANNAKVDRNLSSLDVVAMLSSFTNEQLDSVCFGLRQYLFLLVHIALSMDHSCLIRPAFYPSEALQPRFIVESSAAATIITISIMKRKQIRFSNITAQSYTDRFANKIESDMHSFLSGQESAMVSRLIRNTSGPMTLQSLLDFVACHRLHLVHSKCFQQLFTYCLFRCGETATTLYNEQIAIPTQIGFSGKCALSEVTDLRRLVSVCISLAEVALQDPSCSSSTFSFLYDTFTCILHYCKNRTNEQILKLQQYCEDRMYPRLKTMIESLFESSRFHTDALEELARLFSLSIRCRDNPEDAKVAVAFIETWSVHNDYIRTNLLPDAIRCAVILQKFSPDSVVSDSLIDTAIRNICLGNDTALFRPSFAPSLSAWMSATCSFIRNPIVTISSNSAIEISLSGFAVRLGNGSVQPLAFPNLLLYPENNLLLRDNSFVAVSRSTLPACFHSLVSQVLWRKVGTTQVTTEDSSFSITMKRYFTDPEPSDSKAKKASKPANPKAPKVDEPPDEQALLLKQYPELRGFCGCVQDKTFGYMVREDDVGAELRSAFNTVFGPGSVSFWTNSDPAEAGKQVEINRICKPGSIDTIIDKEQLLFNFSGESYMLGAPTEPLIDLLKGFPAYFTLCHVSNGSCHVLFNQPSLCIPIHISQLDFDHLRLTVNHRLWIAFQLARLLRFQEAFDVISSLDTIERFSDVFQSWIDFLPLHPAQFSLRLIIISRFLQDHPEEFPRLSEHISIYEALRPSLPLQFRIDRARWRVLSMHRAQPSIQAISNFEDRWSKVRNLTLTGFDSIHPRRWKLKSISDDQNLSTSSYKGTNSDTVRVCDQIWRSQTIDRGGFVSLYEILTGRLDLMFNCKRITVAAATLFGRLLFMKQLRLPNGSDSFWAPFSVIDCLLFMAEDLQIQESEAFQTSHRIKLNDQPATLSSFLHFLRLPAFPRGKDGRAHIRPSSSSPDWAKFADRLMSICDAVRPRPPPILDEDEAVEAPGSFPSAAPSRASSASVTESRRKGREPGRRWVPGKISSRQRYDAAEIETEQPNYLEICQSTWKALLRNCNADVDMCDLISGHLQLTTIWMLLSSWLALDGAEQVKRLCLSQQRMDSELVLRQITKAVQSGNLIGHQSADPSCPKTRYISALESAVTFIEHQPYQPASSNETVELLVKSIDQPTILIADNVDNFTKISNKLTAFFHHPQFSSIPHYISGTVVTTSSVAECLGGPNGLIVTTAFAVEKFLAHVQLNLFSTNVSDDCYDFCYAFDKLSKAQRVCIPSGTFDFKSVTFFNAPKIDHGRCYPEVCRDRCNLALHILDGMLASSEPLVTSSLRNNDAAIVSNAHLGYEQLQKGLRQLRSDGIIDSIHFVNYQDKRASFAVYERHLLQPVVDWAIIWLIDAGICSISGGGHSHESTSNLPAADVARRFILADYAAAGCLYERFEYDERSRTVLTYARSWIREIVPFLMMQKPGITFARVAEDDLIARPVSSGRVQPDCVYFQNLDVMIGATILVFYAEGLKSKDTERLITQMQNDWFYEGSTPSQYDRPSQQTFQSWLGTDNISLRSLNRSPSLLRLVHDRVCHQLPAIRQYLTRHVLPQITRWPTDYLSVDLRDLFINSQSSLPPVDPRSGFGVIEAFSCAIRSVIIQNLASSVVPSRIVPPRLRSLLQSLNVHVGESGPKQLKRHQHGLDSLRSSVGSIGEIMSPLQQQIVLEYLSLAERSFQKGPKGGSNAFRCENDFCLQMEKLGAVCAATEPEAMAFVKVSSLPNDSIIDMSAYPPTDRDADRASSKHAVKWSISDINSKNVHNIALPLQTEFGFKFPSIFVSHNHRNLCDIDVILEFHFTGTSSYHKGLYPIRFPSNIRSGLSRDLNQGSSRALSELFGKWQIRFPLDECVSHCVHCQPSKQGLARPKLESVFLATNQEPLDQEEHRDAFNHCEPNSGITRDILESLLDRMEEDMTDPNRYFVAVTLQEASTIFALISNSNCTDGSQIALCLRSLDSGSILIRSKQYQCPGFSAINKALACMHLVNGDVQSTDYNALVLRHVLEPVSTPQRCQMLKHFRDVPGRIRDLRSWDCSPLAQLVHIGETLVATQSRKCFAKLKDGIILRYGHNVISCFNCIDRNGDGFISANELESTLNDLKLGFAPEDFQCIVLDSDMNSDGVIDFDEFMVLVFGADAHDEFLKELQQAHHQIDQQKAERWKAQIRNEEARKEAAHYELMDEATRFEAMRPLMSSLRLQYHNAMSAAKVVTSCRKEILPLQQIHHFGDKSGIKEKVEKLSQKEQHAREELNRSRLQIDEVKHCILKIDPKFGSSDSYAKRWFRSEFGLNDEDEAPKNIASGTS